MFPAGNGAERDGNFVEQSMAKKMKRKKEPTDRQIRERLNEVCMVEPPDRWKWAIHRLRQGKVCAIINQEDRTHCIFLHANCTIEEI